ncbi:Histidine biosynthesis bifunctional protein hisB [Tulasnella sp. 418]|nr:Histidine biosynthesis bifunctional protein hisB [Tulasnella sp. 418]
MDSSEPKLYLLDYGAGNVRSLANSITKLGYSFEWINSPEDFDKADKLIFPGVGAFGSAVRNLRDKKLFEPLKKYVASGRPYFGICIGMQILFRESAEVKDLHKDEDFDVESSYGLGLIDWDIQMFHNHHTGSDGVTEYKSVPHMGWNTVEFIRGEDRIPSSLEGLSSSASYYFVHSYRATYAPAEPRISQWAYTTTTYGQETFVSTVQKDNVFACQFHPEKSGPAGLALLQRWLQGNVGSSDPKTRDESMGASTQGPPMPTAPFRPGFRKRIVACLDVRANDQGDLVVTKGDQYDVREKDDPTAPKTSSGPGNSRAVRNLGKPVALAKRYYDSGADEICLLNITSFRNSPLHDQPMLVVVREAAAQIFVPLTIGGGIKDTVDPDGTKRTALEVAGGYFRAGADKVSIGSEAVIAVEKYMATGSKDGSSAIEQIAKAYGSQAVVVSIDPKRVYIDVAELTGYSGRYRHEIIVGSKAISSSEEEKGKAWWYQCTVSGGRELRELSVLELVRGVQDLGAGEILVNSIDRDGTGRGFDLDLINLIRKKSRIPVVASSGAGSPEHFSIVFEQTGVEAALAAGIFHRREVEISAVKQKCAEDRILVRTDI